MRTWYFIQDQSLNDFDTVASRMLSGFEDFEVVKMQIMGKRMVLHSLLTNIHPNQFTITSFLILFNRTT